MKTLLPVLRNLLTKNNRSISAALLLLLLLCISGISQAQVVYTMGDPASGSSLPGDVVNRMNYDGSSSTQITNGATAGLVQPGQIALDGNNNRIFVSELYLSGNVIKVINATTGALIRTITSANSAYIKAIEYDVVNDWLYYTTEGGDVTVLTATDALFRVHADGSGSQTIATTLTKNPFKIALDVAGNKVYIMDVTFSGRSIKTIDLANGNAVTSRSFAASLDTIWDFAVDTVNGFIYYTCEGGNVLTLTTTDQLRRQNINGTGDVVLISSFAYSPYRIALDLGNNRAYVNDSYSAQAKIIAVNLTNNTYSTVLNLPNTSTSPTLSDIAVPDQPKVTTTAASAISSTSATLAGNLVYGYGLNTERGVVYSTTNATPTISDSKASMATNATNGTYSASVTGLSPSTTYYARAYAKNGAGITYGSVITFTTSSNDANLSALSISAGTLTPGFTSATTSYTATVANTNTSVTITPTRNNAGANIQVNNIAAISGSGSTVNLSIGDNAIPVKVTAQDGTTAKTYTITVTRPKAAQTITFASTATKTYGDADFAPGATTTSGLGISYSSDNTAVATIVSGQIHIVGQGTANITASQAGDGNTLAATSVVQALTVNKNAITVTAIAGQTKVYGNADPTYAYTVTSGTIKSGDSFTGALSRATGESVGAYAITQNTLTLSNNYTLSFVSNDLAIIKRAITITPTIQTKVYGDSDPASFTYNVGGMGLGNGDGMSGLFERPVGENVGVYNLGIGAKHPVNTTTGADLSSNYDITFVSATLTITKRPLTIAPLPVTKVYGTADFSSGAPYNLNGTTYASTDGMTGLFGRDNASEDIGVYALTIGAKHPVNVNTGEDMSGNYDITFVTNTFTITTKSIAVNVYSQTKAYGDADPTLTYTSAPLAFSDTFTGALTRDAGESVGTYAINQGTLALSSNYDIIFVGANLSIGTKSINVTANAQTKTYGTADPSFDYTYDALAFSDGFTGSLTRDAGEDVGTHAITQGSLALNSNYTLNYNGANLSIGKTTLTYVATPVSRPFQNPDPAFTGDVTGFVSGDSQASATTGTLSFTSTATLSSAIGSYPIVGAGLSANNYNFVQSVSNATAFTITASNNALLAGITTDQGTLSPAFSSGEKNYSANVDNTVTSFNFSATLSSPYATMFVNGDPYTSGTSKNIALHTGYNYFTLVTLAQDGTTTDTYSLNLYRAYSTNNLLTSLSLSGITFTPTFDTNTLNYTASVGNLVTSTDVSAAAVDNTAIVSVNGNNLASGPVNYSLVVGENAVQAVSKAESGAERIYTITVTRAQSPDATLASFGNDVITLNTPVASDTYTYSAIVNSDLGALLFRPAATSDRASITINGQALNPYAGNTINLAFGNNAIAFDVTSEDGVNHLAYTLNVNRLRSADAHLGNLSFPYIASLNEEFNPDVYEYTATVADSTYTGIPLSAISANENAIVKIDGTVVPRFVNYTLPIHGGPNTYHIVVTSQDTSSTKTYTLVLTRAGTPPPAQSPVANLAAITISGGTSFSKNFNLSFDELTTVNTPNSVTAVRIFPVSENAVSTITVNGVTIPYDTTTDQLPLSVGDNEFTILVTSEDGVHTKTYTVHINRLPFADVTLASLIINKGTLTPAFVTGTKTYTVTVPNNVSTLNVTPVATSNTVTVAIGATTISPTTPTATVDLFSVGIPANRVRVVVTAADGINTQTYTINVTRLAPGPNLASIALSAGTLSPVFNTETETYTASVPSAINEITVTPTVQDEGAIVLVNGNTVATGIPSAPIALSIGANPISVVSTAQDGVTTKTYSLTITRVASSNVALATIETNPIASLASQSNSTSLATYTGAVGISTSSIAIKPTLKVGTGTLTINSLPAVSGVYSDPVALNVGANIINIVVTAEDGVTTKTYSLTITRVASSNVALATIETNPIASLASQSNSTSLATYTGAVGISTSSIAIKPTLKVGTGTLTINGSPVANGAYSGPVALNVGANIINIVVTAEDGVTTKTYSLTITRVASSNVALATIETNPIASLASQSNSTSLATYTGAVGISTSSIAIKPTLKVGTGTLTINSLPAVSGVYSDPVALNVGANIINIVVTAEDGVTTKTYSLTITRVASSNVALATIETNPIASLASQSNSTSLATYTGAVGISTSSIAIKPTLKVGTGTLTINGSPVANGAYSGPVALNVGANIINIVVTAEDGVTTKTYSLTITRVASSNVALATIETNPIASLASQSNSTSLATYTGAVGISTSSIAIKPTLKVGTGTLTINSLPAVSGVYSDPVALNVGANIINIVVTAEDGVTTKTYSLTITRVASSNVALATIETNPIASLASQSNSTSLATYTGAVGISTSSIVIKSTLTVETGTLTINSLPAVSGVYSDPVALNVGANIINIVVTAEDGVTTKTYSLTITRVASSNVALATIETNPIASLASQSNSTSLATYTGAVGISTSSIAIKPTLKVGTGTLTINGSPVANGAYSGPVALNVGANIINIVVTAEDGVTTKSYNLTITRPVNSFAVNKEGSKLLFANKAANPVAPSDNDGVVVHQGVSPNGDGSNDFLSIEGISQYAGNKLSIMNGNGALVFEAKDYGKDGNNLFDGHSNKNGALLKPGTYFYALEYQVDKNAKRKTGYIIIKY